MTGHPSILVLGIGNLLWADEGFGVRCAEALAERFALPPQVTVMDGPSAMALCVSAIFTSVRLAPSGNPITVATAT